MYSNIINNLENELEGGSKKDESKLSIHSINKKELENIINKYNLPKDTKIENPPNWNGINEDLYYFEMPEYKINKIKLSTYTIYLENLTKNKRDDLIKLSNYPVYNNSIWIPTKPKDLTKYSNKKWISKQENKPKYPIYIISKGRWEQRFTSKFLERNNIDYKIVVEPSEFKNYSEVIDKNKILVLPKNYKNKGSIPARNFVLNHSRKNGDKRHWILDDNIKGYFRYNDSVRVPCENACVFRCIEDYVDRFENIKMAGHNYSMFAISPTNQPIIKNTRIYSSILLSNDTFEWRGKYNEDTDLSLRILKEGYSTALFNVFLAIKEQTLKNKGGNTDSIYSVKNALFKKADSLRKQHPDVAVVKKRFGRTHHYVDYTPFKNNEFILKDNIKINKKTNNYGLYLVDKEKLEGRGKNNFKIVIPSYDRPEILKNQSLETLKNQGIKNEDIIIFLANKKELERYKKIIGDDYKYIIGKKGLYNQMKFINDYFPENYPIVIFHDDIKKVINIDNKLVDLNELINKAFEMLKEKKLNLWGVNKTAQPFFMTDNITDDLRLIEGNFYGMFNKKDNKYKNKIKKNYTAEDIERTILFYKNDGGILRFNNIGKISPPIKTKGGIEKDLGGINKRIKLVKEANKQLKKLYPEYGEIIKNDLQGEVFNLYKKPKLEGGNYNKLDDLREQLKKTVEEIKKTNNKKTSFINYLENIGFSPELYLKVVKIKAKQYGLEPELLNFSTKKNKKLNYNGIDFGATTYKDFIIYNFLEIQNKEPEGTALKKRNLYLKRSKNIKGNWKENKISPNNLSIHILW